ncbi:ubiquitin-conjugating enzyme E2 G1 isoform 2-T2 [Molossus nigricans]
MTELQSALLLRRQLAELNKNPVEGFSAGLIDDNDLYRWEVLIIGPPDTLYEGGVFKAHLTFPKDYPLRPPKMKFITEIWHPNGFWQFFLLHLNYLMCNSNLFTPKKVSLWTFDCHPFKSLIKMVMCAFLFFMSLVKINMVMKNQRNAGSPFTPWKPS